MTCLTRLGRGRLARDSPLRGDLRARDIPVSVTDRARDSPPLPDRYLTVT